MANLEGWHIDPENRRQFRYHDGSEYTQQTSTDVTVATMSFSLFGIRLFSAKSELLPLALGIMAVLGWLFWYLTGIVFGVIGLLLGVRLLRIGRTGLLTAGTVLAATGLFLSVAFLLLF